MMKGKNIWCSPAPAISFIFIPLSCNNEFYKNVDGIELASENNYASRV